MLSGTPLLRCSSSSRVPSFLFPNYFGWVVNAFQLQYQNIIGVDLFFVGAAAFDPFELPSTTHQTPAPSGGRGAFLRRHLAHALPGYFFAIVQGVSFETADMKHAC